MATYITGDIHGEPRERFAEPFANLTADDIVIVCGDFGLPWWSAKYGKSWGDKKRLNWLAKQPYTTVFVDGNHENFHLLNNLPIKIWNGGHVMASEILLDGWIKDVKKRTSGILSMRPKRPFRTVDSRSPEESDALAYAVMLNWNNALESGALKEEPDGSYRICTKKKCLKKYAHKSS